MKKNIRKSLIYLLLCMVMVAMSPLSELQSNLVAEEVVEETTEPVVSENEQPEKEQEPQTEVEKTEEESEVTSPRTTTYALSYNANGGSGSMSNTNVLLNQTITLKTNTFTKSGSTFKGWATTQANANAGVVAYANGASYKLTVSSNQTIYAVWETTQKYTLSFNANGGSNTMSSLSLGVPTTISLPNNAFARSNYTFQGWATTKANADAGTVAYANGASYVMSSAANATLYAVWKENAKYTLSFNANGGTGTMSSVAFYVGQKDDLPENKFTKSGYTFDGWAVSQINANAGIATYDDEDEFTLSSATNVTLYAVWKEAPKYSLSFNANGGIGAMTSLSIAQNATTTLSLNLFVKLGYEFEGWATSQSKANSGIVSYDDGDSYKMTANENVTLYAVWKKVPTYTLSFNANGGVGVMLPMTLQEDVSTPLTMNGFIRLGYTFQGWATSQSNANNGTVAYANGANYTLTSSSNKTLYAVWKVIPTYTLSFNANGGVGIMSPMTLPQNEATPLTMNTFTKAGYTFQGWATSQNNANSGTVAYDDGENYTLTSGSNKTLYAVWKAIPTYTLSFDANGGVGVMLPITLQQNVTTTLTANTFVKLGYTFSGWATSQVDANDGVVTYANSASYTLTASSNQTLYAVWTAIPTYTLNFDANGGVGTMASVTLLNGGITNLSVNLFTKAGFTFGGWATSQANADAGVVAYINGANFTLTGSVNQTLYAIWNAIPTYTLNFDANGGVGVMVPLILMDSETIALTANAFVKTGYTFEGWATSQANADLGLVAYTDSNSFTLSGSANATLYAVWKIIPTYTLSFDANGGLGIMLPQTLPNNASTNLTLNTFTKLGYTFKGWATSQVDANAGVVTYTDGASFTLTGSANVTVYAVWEAIPNFTLNFDANGGLGVMLPLTLLSGETTTLPINAFIKAGYTFQGWATSQINADAGIVAYGDNTSFTLSISLNVTLYAVWQPIPKYTVSFDENGGLGSMSSLSLMENEVATLPANTFTRLDYTFEGWATSQVAADAGTVAYSDDASYTMNGASNKVLYAVWKAIPDYAVNFDAHGGVGAMNPLSLQHNETTTLPVSSLTKFNHQFLGWATTEARADAGTVDFADGASYTHPIAGNVTLYAVWDALPTYAIDFDGNGGTGSMASLDLAVNFTLPLTMNTFTKTGYTFEGWATSQIDADAGTVSYVDGSNFTLLSATNVVLYAVWQPIPTYELNFDANGGSGTMSVIELEYNESTTLPSNAFTKYGYSFKGWATSQMDANNETETYLDNDSFTLNPAADTVLYAVWEALPSYTLDYDSNGGTGTMSGMTIYENEPISLSLNSFSKIDYTFQGWAVSQMDADAGTVAYANGASFTLISPSNTILYAVWQPIPEYNLYFDGNGGTGSMSPLSLQDSETTALPANSFINTGYTFEGWATTQANADLGIVAYSGESSYTLNGSSDTTLYAVWQPIPTYQLNFDANAGSGSMSSLALQNGETTTLPVNSFTKTGYTFKGWATSDAAADAGTVDYADEASYTMAGTENVTLYAVWEVIPSYFLSFDGNGGIGVMLPVNYYKNATATLPTHTFVKAGYTFKGWATTQAAADTGTVTYLESANYTLTADENVVLYAVWEIIPTYFLIFNSNAGSGSMDALSLEDGESTTLPVNTFTKTGYTFQGWAMTDEDADAGTVDYVDAASYTMVGTSNVTLYAVWEAIPTYELSFDANGGTGSMTSLQLEENATVALPNNGFSRLDYTFEGWATSQVDADAGTVTYLDTANYTQTTTSATVLYAVWAEVPDYAVNFDPSGGVGAMNPLSMQLNDTEALPVNTFIFDGFVFEGWAISQEDAGDDIVTYTDGDSYTLTEAANTTLYAVWAPEDTYSLEFHPNGGTGTMPPLALRNHEVQSLPINTYAKSGQHFDGWALTMADANNGVATYVDGDSYAMDITGLFMRAALPGYTLYAVWANDAPDAEYTLSFNANGGTGSMPMLTRSGGAQEILPIHTFVRAGYTFQGWATSQVNANAGIITYAEGATYTYTQSLELFAVWKLGDETTNPGGNNTNGTGGNRGKKGGVDSGDQSNVNALSMLLIGSISVLLYELKRKKENQKSE